jgi:hypothetical protein
MKKLKNLKDGAKFKLSKRASGAVYVLNRKWSKNGEKKASFTSEGSNRTFVRDQSTEVYPV